MDTRRLTNLERVLIVDEGKKHQPYKDSRGFWTIGVGHFIGKNLESLELSERIVMMMLEEDIAKATNIVIRIFGLSTWDSWGAARRDAVTCLVFSMGEGDERRGFLSFRNTIRAIREGKWEEAASNLLDSKWAKDVDPKQREGKGRDDRLAYMLRTGCYHEEYRIPPGTS